MQVCNNLATDEIDDHRIHLCDYKYKSELPNPEGKKSVLGITSAWWNRARHQWQRDHQDPEHLQHSAHEHWHVSAQFSSLLVRFLSSWFTHCTAWLKGVAHVISSTHVMSASLRPWVLHSLPLPHLPIHPFFPALPLALLPLHWGP